MCCANEFCFRIYRLFVVWALNGVWSCLRTWVQRLVLIKFFFLLGFWLIYRIENFLSLRASGMVGTELVILELGKLVGCSIGVEVASISGFLMYTFEFIWIFGRILGLSWNNCVFNGSHMEFWIEIFLSHF